MFLRNLRILLLSLLALAVAGIAAAQGEPTVRQIYETAQAGQLDKARQMTQEVLRRHPGSAKAHFVMAELDAAKGDASAASAELARAESLAPGLPFARPESVWALRAKLDAVREVRPPEAQSTGAVRAPAPAPRETPGSSFPWGLALLAAAAVAVIATVMRSRAAAREREAMRYGGNADGAPGWSPQPGWGPQAGYSAPPAQPGMGGKVMGGLATGLAVGAGALAAQEIGRRMMGEHAQQGLGSTPGTRPQGDSPLARDAGIDAVGGAPARSAFDQDFGIADGGSWDDAGSQDLGGLDDGGNWDT